MWPSSTREQEVNRFKSSVLAIFRVSRRYLLEFKELTYQPALEMMSHAPTKCGNSCYIITYVMCANQKTESCVYHWLYAHAMVDVTCFAALPDYLTIISSILSIRELKPGFTHALQIYMCGLNNLTNQGCFFFYKTPFLILIVILWWCVNLRTLFLGKLADLQLTSTVGTYFC